MITHSNGTATKAEQLNPPKFRASWALAVPQVRAAASDEIVRHARCEVADSGETIECHDKDQQRGKSEGQRFRPSAFAEMRAKATPSCFVTMVDRNRRFGRASAAALLCMS